MNEIPRAGGFQNTWIIKQPITSQPIDRVFVPSFEGNLKETSPTKRRLANLVEGITELLDVLFHLFRLGLEGREGFVKGEDEVVVGKVTDVLKDYF